MNNSDRQEAMANKFTFNRRGDHAETTSDSV